MSLCKAPLQRPTGPVAAQARGAGGGRRQREIGRHHQRGLALHGEFIGPVAVEQAVAAAAGHHGSSQQRGGSEMGKAKHPHGQLPKSSSSQSMDTAAE